MKALWAIAIFVAAPAFGQAGGKTVKDRESANLNEIEHGWYMRVDAGPWLMVNPPGKTQTDTAPAASFGQQAMVQVGRDIADRFSIGAFLMSTNNREGSDYVGLSNPKGTASGDFAALIPGGNIKANLVGFKDAQDVQRTWVYVRGGAGFALFSPKALLPNADILIFGGAGIEYFTRLRHFSIGIEADFAFFLTNAALAFTISPNLRYAF